eukprot:scaffold13150_cov13-Tisochrysis_lutea.AAC.1
MLPPGKMWIDIQTPCRCLLNLHGSPMPILCNRRTNLPRADVPLKRKTLTITPVPRSRVLPETYQTHICFPFALKTDSWLFEPRSPYP